VPSHGQVGRNVCCIVIGNCITTVKPAVSRRCENRRISSRKCRKLASNCHGIYAVDLVNKMINGGGLPPTKFARTCISQNRQLPSCPRRGGRRPGWREQRAVSSAKRPPLVRTASSPPARGGVAEGRGGGSSGRSVGPTASWLRRSRMFVGRRRQASCRVFHTLRGGVGRTFYRFRFASPVANEIAACSARSKPANCHGRLWSEPPA